MDVLFYCLILASLAAVIGAVNKIRWQRACPNDNELREAVLYRNANIDRRAERVTSHLGICEKCQNKINEMNNPKA